MWPFRSRAEQYWELVERAEVIMLKQQRQIEELTDRLAEIRKILDKAYGT